MERKLKLNLFLLFLSFLWGACSLPKSEITYKSYQKIVVGPGPEDMVLDTLNGPARLIISCNERRKNRSIADFYLFDIATEKVSILKRENEPEGLYFQPHGIDLVRHDNGNILLYVVNHNDSANDQSVLIYNIKNASAEFVTKISSPLITSHNDVTATPDGKIFLTLDAHKRGSFMEPFLKLKRGSILRYDDNEWKAFSERYCYANGILAKNNRLFVSSTRQNKLWELDTRGRRNTIAHFKGQDNITADGDYLYVPAHLKQFKFLKHFKDSTINSPSVVFRIDLNSNTKTCVFSDKGNTISAASTAIHYKGNLYISQVFNSFILKCKE